MLKLFDIQQGVALGQLAKEAGFSVNAVTGSVIGALNDISIPQCNFIGIGDAVSAGSIVQSFSEAGKDSGIFPHGEALEASAEVLTKAIAESQDFARHGVNPLIERIVNAVERGEDQGLNTAGRPDVLTYNYSDLWNQNSWLALLSRFEHVAVVPVAIKAQFEEKSTVFLLNALKTGVQSIDAAVSKMLESKPAEFLDDVYNAVFRGDIDSLNRLAIVGTQSGQDWYFSNGVLAADAVAVAFLLAKGYEKASEEEGETIGSTMADSITTVINSAGYRAFSVSKRRDADMREQKLIYTFDRNQVLVNGDLYVGFLTAGGSPELLLGAYYARDRVTGEALLAGRDKYIELYTRNERKLEELFRSERLTRARATIYNELVAIMRDFADDELSRGRREVLADIDKLATGVSLRDLDDLWCVVRSLVCVIFFPYSTALDVLKKYDEVAARLGTDDSALIEYHVGIELAVDYLADSFEFTPL